MCNHMMECFYIPRALQNMTKALTYFTVWTELSYCLLCSIWHHESLVLGETIFVSSQEAFPGFATKRRKNSMDDYTTPSQPPGPQGQIFSTHFWSKVKYALCPHKLNLWCQSDHPLGCKLCMHFLSETFGHCQGNKVHMNNTLIGYPPCVLHFWVWSFVWTLVLSFFFSCSFARCYCYFFTWHSMTINK